jgi:hypothetical protein
MAFLECVWLCNVSTYAGIIFSGTIFYQLLFYSYFSVLQIQVNVTHFIMLLASYPDA